MTTEEFKNDIIPYSRKLYPFINNILKDEEETRDAVQDLMLKLWSRRNDLSKYNNRNAYIITMAKNLCFDMLKKKKPEHINPQEHKIKNLQFDENSIDIKEKHEQVHKIIAKLPKKYKEVIRMRDVNGFSFEEIKATTGFEIPYIRVILSRSRQRVKSELEKIYNYEKGEKLTKQVL